MRYSEWQVSIAERMIVKLVSISYLRLESTQIMEGLINKMSIS